MPIDVLLDDVNELNFRECLLECQLIGLKLAPEAFYLNVLYAPDV
ncbi:hypothetical protein HMPREF0531_12257 [Lactiplantibacillus plantarum subsp. plantarum ATCC 14917 = JCM 1149 = CGMCC 1.2437]|jgi:hypothetical protein|nr:hypothetical protein HMPREF0531_12257 [Lactiplantibacillus plantarum subsp. plantarum ATCC 14917 = JCM 1149 = CGMCC 1.2437]